MEDHSNRYARSHSGNHLGLCSRLSTNAGHTGLRFLRQTCRGNQAATAAYVNGRRIQCSDVGKLNVLTAFLDGGPLKSLIENVQDSKWYL